MNNQYTVIFGSKFLLTVMLLLAVISCSHAPVERRSAVSREGERLLSRGVTLYANGDIIASKTEFEKAAILYDSIDDRIGSALSLINIARIERKSGSITKAEKFLDKAERLADPDFSAETELYKERALLSLSKGETGEALRYGAILRESRDLKTKKFALNLLARIKMTLGDLSAAEPFLKEAIAISPDESTHEHSQSLVLSAEIAKSRGSHSEALKLLESALPYIREGGNGTEIAALYQKLSETASAAGDKEKSVRYMEDSRRVNEAVKSLKSRRTSEDKLSE